MIVTAFRSWSASAVLTPSRFDNSSNFVQSDESSSWNTDGTVSPVEINRAHRRDTTEPREHRQKEVDVRAEEESSRKIVEKGCQRTASDVRPPVGVPPVRPVEISRIPVQRRERRETSDTQHDEDDERTDADDCQSVRHAHDCEERGNTKPDREQIRCRDVPVDWLTIAVILGTFYPTCSVGSSL